MRLTYMYEKAILIHMKTTLNINDALLEEAQRLTGIPEKTALVHAGLEALIAHQPDVGSRFFRSLAAALAARVRSATTRVPPPPCSG